MQVNRPYSKLRGFQSWSISLMVFSILILLARSPPLESNSISSTLTKNGKHASSAINANSNEAQSDTLVKGDVLVKCVLTTPHAQENEEFDRADGTIEIHVHRQLAPIAANAFLEQVSSKHFDGNYIFRVVPNFIIQWGIESPQYGRSKRKFSKVGIDPQPSVYDARRANVRGTLNFAGGNSGTGQVYINKVDNNHLDKEPGSLPFASLGEDSMEIIDSIYDKYKQGSGQVKAIHSDEVKSMFPNMSRIERCWLAADAPM